VERLEEFYQLSRESIPQLAQVVVNPQNLSEYDQQPLF